MEPKHQLSVVERPRENRQKVLVRQAKRQADFYRRSLKRQLRKLKGLSSPSPLRPQSAETLVAKYQKQNGTTKLTTNQMRNVRRRLRREGFQA